MSEKRRDDRKNRTRRDLEQGEKAVDDLARELLRRKVPRSIVVLVCAAAVACGVFTGSFTGGQRTRQPAPVQGTQEIVYTFRSQSQLEDHFEKHGIAMGYEDEQSYLAGANRVVASPEALHKLEEEDGDDVYYLEDTNEFVIVSTKGYIRTYFEPEDGLSYFNRQ